jgi:hypothetical protein
MKLGVSGKPLYPGFIRREPLSLAKESTMKYAFSLPGFCADDGGTNLANCDEEGTVFAGPSQRPPFATQTRLGTGCIEPFPPYEVGTVIPTVCPAF